MTRITRTQRILAGIFAGLCGMSVANAWAASTASMQPVNLPSSVEPERAGSQLKAPEAPLASQAAVSNEAAGQVVAPVSPGADKVKFMLHEVIITGNTAFAYQELSPVFQQYLNHEMTLAGLQKIAHEITLKYRNAGYVLSRAILPAQVIDKGVVHIRVVEGYVSKACVSGYADGAQSRLQAYGDKLTAPSERPLNMKHLERYALLANAVPGMTTVKTVLQPPTDTNAPAGSTEVLFTPEFSKASGFASFDNRGTKYLGPNEYSAGGALNSIIQSGDQWGVQGLAATKWHELRYVNAYTVQPIAATGATLNLSGSYSHTQPGYLLEPLQVDGQSKELVADVQIPWLRTRKQSLYNNFSFDYLNTKTDINLFDANFYDDHIRSARAGLNYYIQDKWAGANQASVLLSHGFGILGASVAGQPNLSRVAGNPQYTKWDGSLSRLQGITDKMSLLVAGIGQYAYQPLLASEQFAFGGTQYGQAYDPAEFSGDHGLAAKAELRYNHAPDWRFLHNVQYFAFYDIGKIWNIKSESVTGLPQEESGSSTGAGLRLGFNDYCFGAVEVAQPLTREVGTYQNFAPRFFVSFTVTGKTHHEETNPLEAVLNETAPVGYTGGAATNGPQARVGARQS